MGQYYAPATIDAAGNLINYSLQQKKIDGIEFINGMKLTEHCYVENSFSDFFSHLLYKNPLAVAWVGDYADDCYDEVKRLNPDFRISERYYPTFCAANHGKDAVEVDFDPTPVFDYHGKYLFNHTKGVYFPLDYLYDTSEYSEVIYPVALLTAMGNGQGGGDYFYDDDLEKVGTWALDILSIDEISPDSLASQKYKEIPHPNFRSDF